MRREFPTSIYSGSATPPRKAQTRKTSLLDIVRAERRLAATMRVHAINEARREAAYLMRERDRARALRGVH